MRVTMFLLRDRFGRGVTFPLRDFLVCVTVYTENDSGLRTCRERGKVMDMQQESDGSATFLYLHLHLPARGGSYHIIQRERASFLNI